jgi:hemerythrin-like domain-containing protein
MTANVAAAPADTRMMGIVHDALRRDLRRVLDTLSTSPYANGAQRAAVAAHVGWMMRFLHEHHHGEDEGLWPLVRAREPRASALLADMAAEHARVAPLATTVAEASRAFGATASDGARVALLDAVQRLAGVLLPHLRREEDDAMPVVSLAITAAEWHAVDQQYFVKPKSLPQLGFEGHWLLDGLDAERSRVVLHQVPAVPRVVLRYGFARRYRRHATACWGLGEYGFATAAPDIPRAGRVEVRADAPIDAVWGVVADVTRTPEWSHECRRVGWLDGATRPALGTRFRGTNHAGWWTWSRTNEVVAVDEPNVFAWRTVPSWRYPDSSEWRIELHADGAATRIVQSYEVLRGSRLLARVYAVAVPNHRDRTTALAGDLRRLGELASAPATTVGAPA